MSKTTKDYLADDKRKRAEKEVINQMMCGDGHGNTGGREWNEMFQDCRFKQTGHLQKSPKQETKQRMAGDAMKAPEIPDVEGKIKEPSTLVE